jgi:hypothetical protein
MIGEEEEGSAGSVGLWTGRKATGWSLTVLTMESRF